MRMVWSWAGWKAGGKGRTLQRWGSDRRGGEVQIRERKWKGGWN